MKIEQQRRKLGSDYTEILDYQIEASGKAFEILFKNIYSDPIKAVLRELGTNAVDSHKEAGKETIPFDIHLPTTLDPCFYIRDYGVGLDGDEIKNIYRVVFKSTKTNSNEQIGCFGLGCKTPFAYTDNYIIEAFKGGKKWICNSFYNDTSKPALAFTVDGEPTSEPDGLKVTIICKNDFASWADKAKEVYRFFTVKPNILGNQIKFEKINYVMEGKDWALRTYQSDPYYSQSKGIMAIMGQIPYRIDTHSISSLDQQQKKIANCGIDIRFNIGDLAVEANREGIHLNERSVSAIKTKLNLIGDELQKQIENQIDKESCLWDASLKMYKILRHETGIANIISSDRIKYKGQKLIVSYTVPDEIKDKVNVWYIDNFYYRKKMPRRYVRSRLDPVSTTIFIKDTDAIESRIKQYTITNSTPYDHVLLVLEDIDNGSNQKTTGTEDLLKELGYPADRLIKLSDLPKLPPVKRTYNRAKTSKVNLLKKNAWEDASIDLKDGQGFYVEMYQQHTICKIRQKLVKPAIPIDDYLTDKAVRPRYQTRKISLIDLCNLQNYMEVLGFPVYNIYGIRSSHVKKLGPRWKNFYEYAESKLNYIIDLHHYEKIIPPSLPNNSPLSKSYFLEDILKKVDKNTKFYKLNDFLEIKRKRIIVEDYLRAYCTFFNKLPNITSVSRQKEVDEIVAKYYLLSKIAPWTIHSSEEGKFVDACVSYINLEEKQ